MQTLAPDALALDAEQTVCFFFFFTNNLLHLAALLLSLVKFTNRSLSKEIQNDLITVLI